MTPKRGAFYTCANSSMIVEIYKIRYRSNDYTKVWLRYYSAGSLRYMCEERSVKLIHNNIKHWYKHGID